MPFVTIVDNLNPDIVPTGIPIPKDNPGFGSTQTIPPELTQDGSILSILQLGVTQWSRIAAWTWCDYLAFRGEKLESKEQKLKSELISLLTWQSSFADGYLNYGDKGSFTDANDNSQDIVTQLLANNLSSVLVSCDQS
jgi:hypothetical protein